MSAPAIILVGGLGTRLRALYPDRPKALVPIRGRPFIGWMLDWLRRHGVDRVHLAAGHLAGQLVEWAAHQDDPHLTVSHEPSPLGTGGGLRYVLDRVAGDELLVLNGDSFVPELALRGWLAEPLTPDTDCAIAVAPIETPGRYGSEQFDDRNRISAFLEKADRPADWVNAGVYRMRRAALDAAPAAPAFSLETDLFPALAQAGRLRAHPTPPPLLDMGTPEGLRTLEVWLDAHPDFFQRLFRHGRTSLRREEHRQ